MSDGKMRVGMRHRNGRIELVDVSNVGDWDEARKFVLEQRPSARVVMALVVGKRPSAVTPVAA